MDVFKAIVYSFLGFIFLGIALSIGFFVSVAFSVISVILTVVVAGLFIIYAVYDAVKTAKEENETKEQ